MSSYHWSLRDSKLETPCSLWDGIYIQIFGIYIWDISMSTYDSARKTLHLSFRCEFLHASLTLEPSRQYALNSMNIFSVCVSTRWDINLWNVSIYPVSMGVWGIGILPGSSWYDPYRRPPPLLLSSRIISYLGRRISRNKVVGRAMVVSGFFMELGYF